APDVLTTCSTTGVALAARAGQPSGGVGEQVELRRPRRTGAEKGAPERLAQRTAGSAADMPALRADPASTAAHQVAQPKEGSVALRLAGDAQSMQQAVEGQRQHEAARAQPGPAGVGPVGPRSEERFQRPGV